MTRRSRESLKDLVQEASKHSVKRMEPVKFVFPSKYQYEIGKWSESTGLLILFGAVRISNSFYIIIYCSIYPPSIGRPAETQSRSNTNKLSSKWSKFRPIQKCQNRQRFHIVQTININLKNKFTLFVSVVIWSQCCMGWLTGNSDMAHTPSFAR